MLLILAIFFATLWLLNRFVFGPITEILDERDREVSEATASYTRALPEFQAAVEKVEADLSLARREALRTREDRRSEGIRLRVEQVEQVKQEAARKLAGASAELEELSRRISADLPARVAAL